MKDRFFTFQQINTKSAQDVESMSLSSGDSPQLNQNWFKIVENQPHLPTFYDEDYSEEQKKSVSAVVALQSSNFEKNKQRHKYKRNQSVKIPIFKASDDDNDQNEICDQSSSSSSSGTFSRMKDTFGGRDDLKSPTFHQTAIRNQSVKVR